MPGRRGAMSITRKYPCARFELDDPETGDSWIAESRAGTGTWVIVQRDGEDPEIVGMMVEFSEKAEILLMMTTAQREALGMSDAVYHALNVGLTLDREHREAPRRDVAQAVTDLAHRVRELEARFDEARSGR